MHQLLRPCLLLGLGLSNKLVVHRCVLQVSERLLKRSEKSLALILSVVIAARFKPLLMQALAEELVIRILVCRLLGAFLVNI